MTDKNFDARRLLRPHQPVKESPLYVLMLEAGLPLDVCDQLFWKLYASAYAFQKFTEKPLDGLKLERRMYLARLLEIESRYSKSRLSEVKDSRINIAFGIINHQLKESSPALSMFQILEAGRELFNDAIDTGRPPGAEGLRFAQFTMIDSSVGVKKPSTHRWNNSLRDRSIIVMVDLCRHAGLNITRNEASSHMSACDLVSEIFRILGVKRMSYSAVVKVWARYKELVEL
ncbi:hypothetical protein Q4485_14520 [Granulosicoccaceae sp. 1_MG-2023]|nr:hypothetical protein [Granulosicoccaceae sp. 1_MG-2023]